LRPKQPSEKTLSNEVPHDETRIDTVGSDGICDDGAGNCTLRAAIEEANACAGADTIDVPVGTYVLTLGQLVIDDELTLIGADAASTIIDGNAVSRIFSVAANVASVELSEFTARNGNDQYGGAFYIGANSPTTIRRAVIRDNTATQAGGAFYLSSNADLTLEECTVTRNKQTGNNPGGHAFLVSIGDNLAIRASTISYNPPAGVAVSSDINDSAILDWTNS
jgi:CSLREA domain-containing protein